MSVHETLPATFPLRVARRERVFDAIDGAGLDAVVLGRRDSVAYATGARSLWTAGTRPFGPACVLVAAGRATHLLSTWDEGVPPDVPFEHLYGITWNPATMATSLAGIPGLIEARRIGVDALSPGFARMVARLAPGAELVPADGLLHAVRAVKLPGEIDCIRAAVAVASAGVGAATDALTTGATPTDARAAAIEAVAAHGVTVPTSGVVVRATADHLWGQLSVPDDRYVPPEALVHIDVGVMVDGYEGGLGRTVTIVSGDGAASTAEAPVAAEDAQARLLDACRPGATALDLRAAAAGSGTDHWMVRGSGMGFEPPVITYRLGEEATIEAGMVLSVEVAVKSWRRRDLVLVGADATEVL